MDRERLIGAWRLVGNVYRRGDGSVDTPFGTDPQGLLIYTEDGYMSVQAGNRERRSFAINDIASGGPEETRDAFTSYLAYFGRFEVDEAAGIVTHFIEGCTMPNWVGEQHRRLYTISDETLVLKTESAYLHNGDELVGILTWARAPRERARGQGAA